MARKGWHVTFEIVTDESASEGEAEEMGLVVEDVSFRDAMREFSACGMDAWATADEADEYPIVHPRRFTCNQWNGGTPEYYAGNVESRSLHIPEHITRSSRLRLARFLGLTVRS